MAGSKNFAKIIDTAIDADQKVRKLFLGYDEKTVEQEKLKELAKTAEEQKKNSPDHKNESSLDETFEKMKREGKNDVDSIVNWMKDAKIINAGKDADQKVRILFQGCDEKNVDLKKFKEVLAKTAEDRKNSPEVSRSKPLKQTTVKFGEDVHERAMSVVADILERNKLGSEDV